MRKRDLADGVVGPRTREAMDQMLCMKGMTLTEKVDFLMSRNRELRAETNHLQAENARLRELVEDMLDCIEIRAAFGRPPTTDMYEQFAKCASKLGVEVDE